MAKSTVYGLLVSVALVSGCAYKADGTNQFYFAQTYLPLPESCQYGSGNCRQPLNPVAGPSSTAKPTASFAPASAGSESVPATGTCAPGPVLKQPNDDRRSLKVLPGMRIDVMQTTYQSNAHNALPVLSTWQWRIPSTLPCKDGYSEVPRWSRSDVLVVRHLTSASIAKHTAAAKRPGPDYFAFAMRAGCTDNSPVDCIAQNGLNAFTAGLRFDVRELTRKRLGFEPLMEFGVLADSTDYGKLPADVTETEGLGRWYAGAFDIRRDDLFDRSTAQGSQGDTPVHCTPEGNGHKGCEFAYSRLLWQTWNTTVPYPGTPSVTELTLIATGDPLLLFQPIPTAFALDPADSTCLHSKECDLRDRASPGFNELVLSLPVYLGSTFNQVYVPVGTTVEAFGIRYRGKVSAIRRSTAWLPSVINLKQNDPKTLSLDKITDRDGRVLLVFDGRNGVGEPRGVIIENAAQDFLIAPGDIVELTQ